MQASHYKCIGDGNRHNFDSNLTCASAMAHNNAVRWLNSGSAWEKWQWINASARDPFRMGRPHMPRRWLCALCDRANSSRAKLKVRNVKRHAQTHTAPSINQIQMLFICSDSRHNIRLENRVRLLLWHVPAARGSNDLHITLHPLTCLHRTLIVYVFLRDEKTK